MLDEYERATALIERGVGPLPYRTLLKALQDQEHQERDYKRREQLRALILILVGLIEVQEKIDQMLPLLERSIP